MGGRWLICFWNGKRVRRSIFMWWLTFGPLPDGWDVHHQNDIRSDWPLVDTLAMPCAEHHRYHRLKDRQVAEAILTRWFFYWANRLRHDS